MRRIHKACGIGRVNAKRSLPWPAAVVVLGVHLGAGADVLPSYQPQQSVSGTIRNHGFAFGGVIEAWEKAFVRGHPGISFSDSLITSDAALPSLVTRVADLAPDGGEATLTETLAFYETRGYHASNIVVATGAFDVPSRSNGMVIFVHEDNPIAKLTVEQLDGIFGSERTAGMVGFQWTPSAGRGADNDIRTWGQLGLTGEWADKPIQTYGHAPSGAARFFQLKVLRNGDKWNPNYREYVETGTKMIADEDKAEQRLGVKHMLAKELANDRYGIAWTIMSQAQGIAGIKPLALAPRGGGAYVAPSKESFQSRSYPLARDIYIYFDRPPGKPIEPRLKEFMRFMLSREGQEIVTQGGYLPLPAATVREQLAKLD